MPLLTTIRVHLYSPGANHSNYWTCRESCGYVRYWDECKAAVESLASGSPPCWTALPAKVPTLEISWYCQMSAKLEDAVRFCNWTKESGLQLDMDVVYNCKAKMKAAQMDQY